MQYKRCGLRNGEKEFGLMMPRPCRQQAKSGQRPQGRPRLKRTHGGPVPTKSGHMSDNGGQRAGAWRSHGGRMADMADAWRTGLETRPKWTQGGRIAVTWDTWRASFGVEAGADPRRTQGGQTLGMWPEHVAAGSTTFFTLYQHRPQTVFKHTVHLQRPKFAKPK